MTTIGVSAWMFLLVPAHPCWPGQNPESRKMLVCVCVCKYCSLVCYLNASYIRLFCTFFVYVFASLYYLYFVWLPFVEINGWITSHDTAGSRSRLSSLWRIWSRRRASSGRWPRSRCCLRPPSSTTSSTCATSAASGRACSRSLRLSVPHHHHHHHHHYCRRRRHIALAKRNILQKIVLTGDWGHFMTLTLTSDDLESHILVNVSSTLTNTTIWFVAALCFMWTCVRTHPQTDIFIRVY